MIMAPKGSYLTTESPVARTVEALGHMALLVKVCHWGWALRLQKTHAISNCSLLPAYGLRCEFSDAAPATSHHVLFYPVITNSNLP